jgi:hypothetical protein
MFHSSPLINPPSVENVASNVMLSDILCETATNSPAVMLSDSEASAFPALNAKQILRLRLRMTFSHSLRLGLRTTFLQACARLDIGMGQSLNTGTEVNLKP